MKKKKCLSQIKPVVRCQKLIKMNFSFLLINQKFSIVISFFITYYYEFTVGTYRFYEK